MTEDPIRVCLVADSWEPRFSGAALRFKSYLPGLSARGVSVNVLTSTQPLKPKGQAAGEPIPTRPITGSSGAHQSGDGVVGTVDHVVLPQGASLRRKLSFDRAIVRHVQETRPHVCHFLNLGPLRSLRLRRLRRVGAVSIFTGTLLAGMDTNLLKRWRRRQQVRIPLSKVDHVVASSTVMEGYFRTLGVRTPISIIPNGVNARRYSPPRSPDERREERVRLGVPPDAEMILFVGKVNRRKGVDLLLHAFRIIAAARPNTHLYVVGPRVDSTDAKGTVWNRYIEDLRGPPEAAAAIHFVGESDQVPRYMKAADVFVLPSRREGMGNVVLEAMAAGLPCVLTPFIGLAEELGHPGRDYVVSGFDPRALAEDITTLLADSGLRSTIGAAARRWVVAEQDVESSIDAYANLYRRLGAERPASARDD